MKNKQLNISITPELEALITKTVAERVRRNGVYMSRGQFLSAELTAHLTELLKKWAVK